MLYLSPFQIFIKFSLVTSFVCPFTLTTVKRLWSLRILTKTVEVSEFSESSMRGAVYCPGVDLYGDSYFTVEKEIQSDNLKYNYHKPCYSYTKYPLFLVIFTIYSTYLQILCLLFFVLCFYTPFS